MIDAVQPKPEKKLYKVVLILLVGLSSISTARQDLNQLISTATDVQAFANQVLEEVVGSGKSQTPATCKIKRFVKVDAKAEGFRFDRGPVIQLPGSPFNSSTVGIQ